jgi:RNA polymerase sigma factor (sigma-70 family)
LNKGRDFCYKSLITNKTNPVVEISQLLVNWSKGDEAALEQLMPFVYAELRKMARTYLRQRGGGDYAVTLSWVERERGDEFDLITLDEALNELAVERPRHSRIVELRFFGGLTIEETAQALGVSHATVEREWRLARAWLHRQVSQETARRRV